MSLRTWTGIDRLIPIGGDDTLSYGERLHSETFPVIAIPKTMDNDVYGTDYRIGFSTAVTRSVQFIHQLRTSTGSHERIAVVGACSGPKQRRDQPDVLTWRAWTAVISGKCRSDPERLAELVLKDKKANPSNYAMVTISEGATVGGKVVQYGEQDAYGHQKPGGIGEITGEALKKLTGENIIYQQLSYLMRPCRTLDLMVGVNYANLAMDLITSGERAHGRPARRHLYPHPDEHRDQRPEACGCGRAI